MNEQYLTVAEVRDFLSKHRGLEWIDIVMFDMGGQARGKRYRPAELEGLADKGIMVPSTVYILDTRGNTVEETGLLWETGDPDILFRILAGTLAPSTAGSAKRAQAIMVPIEDDGGLDPRRILQRHVSELAKIGATAVTAVELEFYVTKRGKNGLFTLETPDASADDPDFSRLYQFDEIDALKPFIDDIYNICEAQNLPVGAILQESGPSQFEINLNHRADAVAAALDGLLLKRAVKSAAEAHGLIATFMAKPHHDWSGNGMHIHASLIDSAGKNLFAGEPISQTFRYALGGLQTTMPDYMGVWAQSANAYRRYVPKSYVAMAAHWGHNNRNVALRIPRSSPNATRVEHRVAGADANPYLVIAAILAGIRHGIANKIEPGPMAEGAASNCPAPELPTAWVNALKIFEKSPVVRDAFGPAFHDCYHTIKNCERIEFERTVTALDYQWYAEVA